MEGHYNHPKGQKLFLKLFNGETIEGFVKSANEATGRISLTDGTFHPSGQKFKLNNFFANEIEEVYLFDKPFTDSLPKEEADNLPSDEGCSQKEKNSVHTVKLSEMEFNQLQKHFITFRYIYRQDSNFYRAVNLFNEATMISLFLGNANNGRFGRASVIALSIPTQVVIFDLDELGDSVFTMGLKSVLESDKIVKVTYDGRLSADCLRSKHLIMLNNVRDVEAEDILVERCYTGKVRRDTKDLNQLIEYYLGIPSATEHPESVGFSWKKRPLAFEVQKAIVTKVIYLILLHQAIQEKYLQFQFYEISNLYVKSLHGVDEVDLLEHSNTLVPTQKIKDFLKFRQSSFDS